MIDREKIIKALEVCSSISDGEECPKECPYRGQDMYCVGSARLMLDALDLLKEQEPVSPIDEKYWNHTLGRCGHCKAPLPAIEGLRSKFCWMCGRAVKWE